MTHGIKLFRDGVKPTERGGNVLVDPLYQTRATTKKQRWSALLFLVWSSVFSFAGQRNPK
jgi:hypothetical protein